MDESCEKDPCLEVLKWPALGISLLRLLSLPRLSADAVRDSARDKRVDSCCNDEISLASHCESLTLGNCALVNARKSERIAALSLQWLRAIFFHNAALSL